MKRVVRKPNIYWRGDTARVMFYSKIILPDGRIVRRYAAHNQGKVTVAEAERMRDELMAVEASRRVV